MSTDKAAYLAAHYLNADPKPSKKRKSKSKNSSKSVSGLVIADDNDDAWGSVTSKHRGYDDDDDGPAVVAGTSSEFRKSKKSSWKTVGVPIPTDTKDARDATSSNDADAVLAAVAAETAAAQQEDDAAPTIADADGDVDMLADGTHAGLQTAAAVTAQQEVRRRRERAELAQLEAERAAAGDQAEDEVVLRDATGRRIDVSMRRAEARKAAAEAERAAEAKTRLLKGEVQAEQARARREALADAAVMPLARGVDDAEMNRDLKAQERWNDPMAQFLAADTGSGGNKKGGRAAGRRPVYKGAAPPNRYGIKPGYRWDGVDRGNGFEAERFKAINRRERNKTLDYSWQQDV